MRKLIEVLASKSNLERLAIGLLLASLFIIVFNAFQIYNFEPNFESVQIAKASSERIIASAEATVDLTGIDVIPKGMPSIYGKELAVSYDDVSLNDPEKANKKIAVLGALDDKLKLSEEEMKRYISIAGMISCEYCCGANSIITKTGQPACGCAHSYAMRGLAKYLIKNHPDEFTDDEILEELGKWKTLFFPGKLTQKAAILRDKGIELNYINLASNKYRSIESSAMSNSGSENNQMAGGC